MPHPQPRSVARNRSRPRRFSACHRHPSEPVTGFCALCLRDRLAGLDSSSGQIEVEKVGVSSRRTRDRGGASGASGASATSSEPEFRRSKSVAGKCEVLNDFAIDLRRKSCDVRARSSLSDLFEIDDPKNRLVNLGFSNLAEPVLETKEEEEGESDNGDEIRVLDDEIDDDDDEIEEEGDLKTMKEIIEIELHNKRRNFWEAASVFSKKLRNWRQKHKEKKQSRCINGGIDINRSKLGQLRQLGQLGQISYNHGIHAQSEVADYGFGRRSCDTEPRFSIDAHRLSVEDPRASFDEHRASWDGYMMARTIPRLTPMLPIGNNMMHSTTIVENLQMHSIIEDGVSSGGSAQSISDSSTSNRGSSSSSMKSSSTKTAGLTSDDAKSASNARVSPANDVIFQPTKLVITEKELKDWHLNSIKNNNNESVTNTQSLTTVTTPSNGHKKVTSSKWKKVCNLWNHKDKLDDRKNEEDIQENRAQTCNSSMNLVRNPNLVNSRNRNMRYSSGDVDSGLLRLYLTPFRNSRRNKSGKSRGPSMAATGMQLN